MKEEFANASKINELNLRSNGIFTVHPHAFKGMTALKKLYVCVLGHYLISDGSSCMWMQ
jgi:hypothetical protein